MRPIKFRGKRIDNGEFVYGDLQTHFRTDGKTKVFVIRTWERLDDWVVVAPNKSVIVAEYYERPVEPESVAQLVGYDKNGNEVYEGDKILIDDAGEDEFFATCLPVGVNHWGGCFLHGGNFIFTKEFSLKEACQNPWNALQEIDNLIERHVEEAKQ